MRLLILGIAAASLAACQADEQPPAEVMASAENAAEPAVAASPAEVLAGVLAAQPEEVQARYEYRNPAETLAFFGVEPGMTVVEALPGGGWYTKILLPYLGRDGKLIGAGHALDM